MNMNANLSIKVSFIYISLLITLAGCQKDEIVIRHELEVASGELLEFKFDRIPAEGMKVIKIQAEHFVISELAADRYRYQSVDGFKGTEVVMIESRSGSGGENLEYTSFIELEILVK